MKPQWVRGLICIAVFAVIFWGSQILVVSPAYDVYVRALEFLAAVIGAGCYWIGNRRE